MDLDVFDVYKVCIVFNDGGGVDPEVVEFIVSIGVKDVNSFIDLEEKRKTACKYAMRKSLDYRWVDEGVSIKVVKAEVLHRIYKDKVSD